MVNIFHRKVSVNDDFGVSKVVTSTQHKKKDKEHGTPKLQTLLDVDESETQKQLTEKLCVSQ